MMSVIKLKNATPVPDFPVSDGYQLYDHNQFGWCRRSFFPAILSPAFVVSPIIPIANYYEIPDIQF
jgi:hypothetical protein